MVYCQLDPQSQITLVTKSLVEELGLKGYDSISSIMETLNGEKKIDAGLVKLDVESLSTSESFHLENIVCSASWSDDAKILLYRKDLTLYRDFDDAEVFEWENCKTVDMLVGN